MFAVGKENQVFLRTLCFYHDRMSRDFSIHTLYIKSYMCNSCYNRPMGI